MLALLVIFVHGLEDIAPRMTTALDSAVVLATVIEARLVEVNDLDGALAAVLDEFAIYHIA